MCIRDSILFPLNSVHMCSSWGDIQTRSYVRSKYHTQEILDRADRWWFLYWFIFMIWCGTSATDCPMTNTIIFWRGWRGSHWLCFYCYYNITVGHSDSNETQKMYEVYTPRIAPMFTNHTIVFGADFCYFCMSPRNINIPIRYLPVT